MKILCFVSIFITTLVFLIPIWILSILSYKEWKEKTELLLPICLTIPITLIDILTFLYFFG